MASTGMKDLTKHISDSFDLEMDRRSLLFTMQDSIEKQWILELLSKVKSLEDEKARILKSLGNTGFAPIQY